MACSFSTYSRRPKLYLWLAIILGASLVFLAPLLQRSTAILGVNEPAFQSSLTISYPRLQRIPKYSKDEVHHPAVGTTKSPKQVILTLFTSFKDSPNREPVHRNTIENWSKFRPLVQPVLYTVPSTGTFKRNNTLEQYARECGWKVLPCEGMSEKNVPVLKWMFQHAISAFQSSYYGYANGDILFDAGLTKTLTDLSEVLDRLPRLLIIGARTDCPVDKCPMMIHQRQDVRQHQFQVLTQFPEMPKHTPEVPKQTPEVLKQTPEVPKQTPEVLKQRPEVLKQTLEILKQRPEVLKHRPEVPKQTPEVLKQMPEVPKQTPEVPKQTPEVLKQTPEVVLKSAQDYFLTTRNGFDWRTIPEFVIGRAGYDNWLVVSALVRGVAVIDASGTVKAWHQMIQEEGHSSHLVQPKTNDSRVNYDLAGRGFDYSAGVMDCAPMETVLEGEGSKGARVSLRKRELSRYCKRNLVMNHRIRPSSLVRHLHGTRRTRGT